MIRTKIPPRGSFDYLLKDLNDIKPVVRNDPPPPPERGGGPGKVRIEIEINQRQAPPPQRRSSLLSVLIFLGIVLALASAHGEQRWDQNEWHGSSFHFKDSNTTYSDFYGPNGQTRSCTSFKFKDSNTTYVDCH
jgi:hypothetical protein